MRQLIVICGIVLCPFAALAAPPEKMYFLGEMKMSGADGKSMGSAVIMVEKTQDRDKSLITERAIIVRADGKVEDQTVTLTVKDDNSFLLVDTAKTVEGTGQFFGPAWKWTYFKGTFKHVSGVVIDDENFMADETIITARKKITAPGGKVVMYMEMSVRAIPQATFEILATGLLKK
jgi:hypothetical protein